MKTKNLIVFTLALVLLVACKTSKITSTQSNSQLLTRCVWQPLKSIQQIGNTEQTMYVRDILNTTPYEHFGNVRFSFKTDGTGVLSYGDGQAFSFTWSFAKNDESTLNMTIDYKTSELSFVYNFINLSNSSFIYTETYLNKGIYVTSQNIYVPAPEN